MSEPPLAGLHDPDPAVRARSCRELVRDPSAVLFAPALEAALGDDSRAVQRAAAEALVALAPRDPDIRERLRRGLRSPDRRLRRGALDAIRRLEAPEPGWLPAIVEALACERGDERWIAARLLVELARLHPETRGVAGGLARDDARPRVRRMALFCLRQLSPGDEVTERLLLAVAREDRDAEVRRAARLALAADARRPGGPLL